MLMPTLITSCYYPEHCADALSEQERPCSALEGPWGTGVVGGNKGHRCTGKEHGAQVHWEGARGTLYHSSRSAQ